MWFSPLVLLAVSVAVSPRRLPADEFADALASFRAGDYHKAARVLPTLGHALPRNRDYYLYFAAESEFYAEAYAKAETLFSELGRLRDSGLSAQGPWLAADCL